MAEVNSVDNKRKKWYFCFQELWSHLVANLVEEGLLIAVSLTLGVLLKGKSMSSLLPSFYFKQYLIYCIYKSKLLFIKPFKIFR